MMFSHMICARPGNAPVIESIGGSAETGSRRREGRRPMVDC
jgi:hypothetical protein